MPKNNHFEPHYSITPTMAGNLMRVEAVNQETKNLPMTPMILASLRKSARLESTHYSTKIEGNRLSLAQVEEIILHEQHVPGRDQDEREIEGYYAALDQVETWATKGGPITQTMIQKLHAIVMSGGRKDATPSAYRDGQNVIRNSNRNIVYLPPEAQDVPHLMQELITWIARSIDIPAPIVAGIAHYQFATIHPYNDGNGRTARLLATLILHTRGYDLKGIYSLEEYYADNLPAYYEAISIGIAHNYYMGRAQADITSWLEYFIQGMTVACENVWQQMTAAVRRNSPDHTQIMRGLDARQRKVLGLFQEYAILTSGHIGTLLGLQSRTASKICASWVKEGFLEIVDPSKKGRKYKLAEKYQILI